MMHAAPLSTPTSPYKPGIRSILTFLIVGLALISRFAGLGERVMSHDEVNHVVPSYELSQGEGYVHSPVTHGPFQFHIVALTYFLFGDSDTTSRIPAALFSVAAVLFILFAFPPYLGRNGALIAGMLFTISPFMMFYGRYTRNEGFIELIGVVLLYGILRYLETGDRVGLTLAILSTGLHFVIKETAFIYTAQALIFLFIMFLFEARQAIKDHPAPRHRFLMLMIIALLTVFLALGIGIASAGQETARLLLYSELGLLVIAGILGLVGLWSLARVLGWGQIKQMRSFSLLLLLATLILPMLSPLPVHLLGWDALDTSSAAGIFHTGFFVLLFFLISAAIGLWWNPVLWLQNGLLFYGIFTVLYTTFFTNPDGFLTGLTGSLSYWLSQQAEERGSQPVYYYALIQMPVYEFLGATGTLLAAYFGLRHHRLVSRLRPVLGLLLFWAGTSLVAYSLAGERMPWLTVHIALPCLLASGWGLGRLVDTTDWARIFHNEGLLHIPRGWYPGQILRLVTALIFAVMAVLTARAAFRASFLDADYAYEYLVYAHSGPAPKQVLQLVETISRQTAGEKALRIAYGGEALYPYWWYLRDYPNSRYFGTEPTRDLREEAVIIAGDDLFETLQPVVKDDYMQFEYVRLWWPNQDYWYLTWDRVWGAVANPQMRSAIFQIWLNRDYHAYASLTDDPTQFAPETWQPAKRMRVYIRKGIAAQVLALGAGPALSEPEKIDPYARGMKDWTLEQIIGSAGNEPGHFQSPRGIKIAADGSLYVADSRNHRVQHIASDGSVLQVWGSFADSSLGKAPGGTFNEPWDVAVGIDGSVYVADTWNHRIQKFSADGRFLKLWGYFGQGKAPDAFWGPRGLAVDRQGRLFVVDTGNKRVVVFDPDGAYITQFGSVGMRTGEMDEPVGIAIDSQGNVYIADTWNLRVQVFSPVKPGETTFQFTRAWEIAGWAGQSLENKPFLAVHPLTGNVLVTDPEAARVLEFENTGAFLRGWSSHLDIGGRSIGIISGIAVDNHGAIWISDAVNQALFRFR